MVLLATQVSSQIYEVFNERAEPIGEVVRPVNPRLLGQGEGTVLLIRPVPRVRSEE
ncbi:MAG: hypothetical protein AB7I33_04005 [Gemmatimonadales bacterium]